jgi:hypothetical protein
MEAKDTLTSCFGGTGLRAGGKHPRRLSRWACEGAKHAAGRNNVLEEPVRESTSSSSPNGRPQPSASRGGVQGRGLPSGPPPRSQGPRTAMSLAPLMAAIIALLMHAYMSRLVGQSVAWIAVGWAQQAGGLNRSGPGQETFKTSLIPNPFWINSLETSRQASDLTVLFISQPWGARAASSRSGECRCGASFGGLRHGELLRR